MPDPRWRAFPSCPWLAVAGLLATGCLSTVGGVPVTGAERSRSPMPDLPSHVFVDPESGLRLPYRLFVPAACAPATPCGLLVFLHGAGERGSDNRAQLENDALAFIAPEAQAAHPTIVVYPQCPTRLQWVNADWTDGTYQLARTPPSKPVAALMKLLDELQTRYPVDPTRLLVTGLSMGGYGTWDLVTRHPTLFAGALALCGGGDPTQAHALRDLPVWAFHGSRDQAVPVRGSRSMVQALRNAGGTPRYTEVAGGGHDVWTIAYRDVEVVRWLLAQRREPTK